MKCPAVMNGYHNRPDLPSPITADGYYVTGDVFRRDEDGFHYFRRPHRRHVRLGRREHLSRATSSACSSAIRTSRRPAWCRSRTTSRARSRSPSSSSSPASARARTTVKQYALANAPAYQHPRFVWFVDELPLASTNKVDRVALRRLAQERVAATGVVNALLHLQPDRIDDRLPAHMLLGHVAPGLFRSGIRERFEAGGDQRLLVLGVRQRGAAWPRRCAPRSAFGVAAGAKMPSASCPIMLGTPCSIAVGMSGRRSQALPAHSRPRCGSFRTCGARGSVR